MAAHVHTQHTAARHQRLRNLRFDQTILRCLSSVPFCSHEKKVTLVNPVSLRPQLSSHLLSCKTHIRDFQGHTNFPPPTSLHATAETRLKAAQMPLTAAGAPSYSGSFNYT